uniref:Chromosome 8 open reading frame 82 n=1 Tax=Calidris pygmaea TaxID=425635 RepID=A0A8C3J0G8_9CHAR
MGVYRGCECLYGGVCRGCECLWGRSIGAMSAYRGAWVSIGAVSAYRGLFLDDTKVKNFITCFKDVAFLAFFFKRLEPNRSGRYEAEFPFLSPCGGERNFLRCEDRPIVFTHLLPPPDPPSWLLSYCGGGHRLAVPFQPQSLVMLPENGRLYHPAPAKSGGVGLVRSALALEWSSGGAFEFGGGPTQPPTHFLWGGQRYRLTEELLPLLRGGEEVAVPLAPRQG